MLWIEHYLEREGICGQESFDRVTFTETPHGFEHPHWRPSSKAEVEALLKVLGNLLAVFLWHLLVLLRIYFAS